MTQRNKAAIARRSVGHRITVKCHGCQKELVKQKNEVERHEKEGYANWWCSAKCKHDSKHIIKACRQCGTKFEVSKLAIIDCAKDGIRKGRFCCRTCRGIYYTGRHRNYDGEVT